MPWLALYLVLAVVAAWSIRHLGWPFAVPLALLWPLAAAILLASALTRRRAHRPYYPLRP